MSPSATTPNGEQAQTKTFVRAYQPFDEEAVMHIVSSTQPAQPHSHAYHPRSSPHPKLFDHLSQILTNLSAALQPTSRPFRSQLTPLSPSSSPSLTSTCTQSTALLSTGETAPSLPQPPNSQTVPAQLSATSTASRTQPFTCGGSRRSTSPTSPVWTRRDGKDLCQKRALL